MGKLSLSEIFSAMFGELKEEIKNANGFKFTSKKLDQTFNLEKDLLDGDGKLNIHGEGTIYAWIIQYVTTDESLANRDLDANELHALFRQLINACGIYGHQIGLRISNFIEYATQMEDPLILDRIMALSLQEDYAALGIDNDMAELLVSTLSGEMLSMLMKENLENYLLDWHGVTKHDYQVDKYAWVQRIKEAMEQRISDQISGKSNAILGSIEGDAQNKVSAQSNEKLSANDMAKILFQGGDKNSSKNNVSPKSANELASSLFKSQSTKKHEDKRENKKAPKNLIEERTTPGKKLEIIDMNVDNFEEGAKILLCILLNHFTNAEFDPDLLKPDDLLAQLVNFDTQNILNVSTNICHHFQELGNLHNPEIQYTADDPKKLSVGDVIAYAKDMVNDPDSAYVKLIEAKNNG